MPKFLIIGNTVKKKINFVTGQAMMIEVFISVVANRYNYKVCSLSPIFAPAKIGSTSLIRYIEYIWILLQVTLVILCNPKAIIYLSPAATPKGFKRDYFLFKLGSFMRSKFIFQQFTALFSDFYDKLSSKEKKKVENMYNKAELIVVEGDFEKQQFQFIKNKNKIHTIPNGLPEAKTEDTTNPKTYIGGTFNMLFLNNMIESKGYWEVLESIDILVNKLKRNITCDFVGRFYDAVDDKRYKDCRQAEKAFFEYIEKHNLKENVHYRNCAYEKEKKELFENAHILLLPSYFLIEGQPTVILEALSYGCVPIVTKYRLIPEMVNEDNGIFVQPQNAQSIADAICSLMDNPTKYNNLSRNDILQFKKKFTRKMYEEKIAECIKPIINSNK